MALVPRLVSVRRASGDDYLHKIKVGMNVAGYTFALTIEGKGSVAGVIVSTGATSIVSFDLANASPSDMTALAAATYHHYVIMTDTDANEWTICHGDWVVVAR